MTLDPQTRSQVRQIARRIEGIDRRLSAFERSTQLAFASVPDANGDEQDVAKGVGDGIKALPKAEDALSIAGAAQESADGKGTVFYDSPADAPDGGPGDVLFDPGDGFAMYRWDGSSWVPAVFGTPALADRVVTASKLADGSVDARTLADGSVSAPKLTTAQHVLY
jgi:hypothetical protein